MMWAERCPRWVERGMQVQARVQGRVRQEWPGVQCTVTEAGGGVGMHTDETQPSGWWPGGRGQGAGSPTVPSTPQRL